MSRVYADRVLDTTTSTGTGNITLAGPVTGFQRLSDVCSTGDTLDGTIFAVDGSGVPTGEWETGHYTYSGANTLTRTTVQDSSNAGALVDFAAGSKYVMLSQNAASVDVEAMVLLEKIVLSSAAASVEFSAIDQSYGDLVIMVTTRQSGAVTIADIGLQVNGDTGANYAFQNTASVGTSAENFGAAAQSDSAFVGRSPGASGTAGCAGTLALEVPNYANSTFHKAILSRGGSREGAATLHAFNVWAEWSSTAPITDLEFIPASGNFVSGSTFALYGRV